MPFDANLVLANDAGEWTEANLVGGNNYGSPVSIVRNDGGLVVIDLLAISTTAAVGMAAVLIIDEAGAASSDALTVVLQASNDVDFVADSNNDVHTLANFEVAGVTHGVILGNECPCTVVRRFTTKLRYIRIDASNVASDDFHTVWCMLAPWPFNLL